MKKFIIVNSVNKYTLNIILNELSYFIDFAENKNKNTIIAKDVYLDIFYKLRSKIESGGYKDSFKIKLRLFEANLLQNLLKEIVLNCDINLVYEKRMFQSIIDKIDNAFINLN